jgi:Glucodextranase, domain B
MLKIPFHIKPQSTTCLLAAVLISSLLLGGCSGGGKEATATLPVATATATGGLLKLGTSGAATDLIAGIDLLVSLPAGVTIDADPSSGEAATGAVTVSGAAAGSNSLVVAKYAPAGAGVPATLHMVLLNAAGFHPGEFATVRFNVAAGAGFPALNAFTVADFTARGVDSSVLGGVTAAASSVAGVGNATKKNIVIGVPAFLNISVATPTRFPSQTISGTLNSGDTLTISTNTAATVSAPVTNIAGTTWSALVSELVEGANIITVTEKTGAIPVATVSATIIFDKTPPFINIDTVIGQENLDVGRGIAGTAEEGSTIVVTCDKVFADVIFFDDFAQHITRWSAMILGHLFEGDNYCRVIATDAAGNVNVKEVDFVFDDIPPLLDIHFDEFIKFGDIYTLSGTADAGVTPSITVNGVAYSGTITTSGSTWSAPLSGLSAGANTVTVTATDAAGNATTKTVTLNAVAANGSFSGAALPTITDAVTAMRMAVGLSAPTPAEKLRGDLLADGKIDLGDAILILKKCVGL